MIVNVTNTAELEALPLPSVLVVTDPATCAPCRSFAPHFEAAANKASGKVTFAKITMSELKDFELITNLGVQSIPAVFLVDGPDDFEDAVFSRLAGRTSVSLLKEITALNGVVFEPENLVE